MRVEYKVASLKADTRAPGEFTGYASTWTRTPDSYGDVVRRGAFADTLAAWEATGRPIPALWGHRMDDPTMFIGTVKEAVEDDHGLLVRVALDLDNPVGAQVHRLLKTGSVAQMSFAFDVLEDATVEVEDGVKARELRRVSLYEVSVVPLGANQDTSIEDVKSRRAVKDDGDGGGFTAEQVAALREIADEWIADHEDDPEEGEGGGNAEAAQEGGKAEAVARLNCQIAALAGRTEKEDAQ